MTALSNCRLCDLHKISSQGLPETDEERERWAEWGDGYYLACQGTQPYATVVQCYYWKPKTIVLPIVSPFWCLKRKGKGE